MSPESIIPILQVSISPVVLISGIGLLLLSMTNRLGRVVDRARILGKELRGADASNERKIRRQLRMLYRRAQLLRSAIFLSSTSILLVALLILTLFLQFALSLPVAVLAMLLFAGSVVALIGSMAVFLQDLAFSLRALWTEIADQV